MDTKFKAGSFQSGNTAQIVLERLRAQIVHGQLPANHPLRQDKIAEQFGVSKVPVREALIQLKAEGLVTFLPNRGAVVSDLSVAEAEELFLMRTALETAILRRAVPRLTRADLIRAEGVLRIIEQEEDRALWGELNWEFHATLYQAAGLPRMMETIRALHDNVGRYLSIYLAEEGHRRESQQEHWLILKACRENDADSALACLEKHLRSASERLAAVLGQQAPEGRQGGEYGSRKQ